MTPPSRYLSLLSGGWAQSVVPDADLEYRQVRRDCGRGCLMEVRRRLRIATGHGMIINREDVCLCR